MTVTYKIDRETMKKMLYNYFCDNELDKMSDNELAQNYLAYYKPKGATVTEIKWKE